MMAKLSPLTTLGLSIVFLHIGFINSNAINEKDSFNENKILRDSKSEIEPDTNKLVSHSVEYDSGDNVVMIEDENFELSLEDQVKLLSKQLNALSFRRREDFKMLENNLKKSLRITTDTEHMDINIREELQQLRHEIKILREGHNSKKEKLTVDWLSQSISEIRKEITELQEIASNASKDINRRGQSLKDLETIRNEFHQFKLELEALKERQATTEVFIRELRDESIQKEDDFKRILQHNLHDHDEATDKVLTMDSIEESSDADHKMRHHRFLRQQMHDLEMSQRNLRKKLNEFHYHHIDDRVQSLEIEQRRLATANFNLSRQIASLDKLHTSMLELLEDVEGIQNKMDTSLPEVRREISKLEFSSAQLNSEQRMLREENGNVAKSMQAMAVSVSALQDERDHFKEMQTTIDKLRQDVDSLQMVAESHKSIVHRRIEKMESDANRNLDTNKFALNKTNGNEVQSSIEMANKLVQQLETVELEYESIINKLPTDCSQVQMSIVENTKSSAASPLLSSSSPPSSSSTSSSSLSSSTSLSNGNGLYLIAPAGQHRPQMAHCSNGWTTVQRRFDGSVDFNQSWDMYAQGFGSPSGEFWIGNEMLHHLTLDNCTELKIIMQDIYENTWEALYENFYISSRDDGYRLHLSGYRGNASDALDYQNLMQFSAIDVDRDISNTHCAANYEGGWWFSHCQHANLNGRYNLGLTWFDASRNEWIAVKSSHMSISKSQKCLLLKNQNNSSNNTNSSDNKNNNTKEKQKLTIDDSNANFNV